MGEQVLRLGTLHLNYPKAGLQLCLGLSTTILWPTPSQTARPTDLSQKVLLAALLSRSVWVRRGQAFHLSFDITAHGEFQDIAHVRSFAYILTGSAVFRQLGLHASLSFVPLETAGFDISKRCLFRINLNYDRDFADDETSKLHRLFAGVSSVDIKPPAAVSTVLLHSVRFEVTIINFLPVPEEEQPDGDQEVIVLKDVDAVEPLGTDRLDQSTLCASSQPTQVPIISLHHAEHSPATLGSDQPSQSQPATLDSSKANGTTSVEVDSQTSDNNSPSVHKLLDAAIRRAFSAKLLRTVKGVSTKADNLHARLADIAPALFSPGYLEAISRRACFVPTISEALSRSVLRNVQSVSLKSKLLLLSSSGEPQSYPTKEHTDRHVYTSKLDYGPDAKIWRILQTTLFDVKAARKLKPLTQPSRMTVPVYLDHDAENEALFGLDEERLLGGFDMNAARWPFDDFSDEDLDLGFGEDFAPDAIVTYGAHGFDSERALFGMGAVSAFNIVPDNHEDSNLAANVTTASQHPTASTAPDPLAPTPADPVTHALPMRSETSAAAMETDNWSMSESEDLFKCASTQDVDTGNRISDPTLSEESHIAPRDSPCHSYSNHTCELGLGEGSRGQSASNLHSSASRTYLHAEHTHDKQDTEYDTNEWSELEHDSSTCHRYDDMTDCSEELILDEVYDQGYYSRNASQSTTVTIYDEATANVNDINIWEDTYMDLDEPSAFDGNHLLDI